MAAVSVRYIVEDVPAAVAFYTTHLGFQALMQPGPGFAMLSRGDLRLLLSAPGGGGGAGRNAADGRRPEPGGWNRFQLEVSNLDSFVRTLAAEGASFRSEVVVGNGGKQVVVDDPSGNPIELFEPHAR